MDENLTPEQERLTRWIDQALEPEEERALEASAEGLGNAQDEKAQAEAVGQLLRRHLPPSLDPPYPDFFQSQILKRIREAEAPSPKAKASGSFWQAIWGWFRSPVVAAATAAVTVAALAWFGWRPSGLGDPVGASQVVSAFSPELNVHTKSYYSEEAQATIIELEGLAPVSDAETIEAFVPPPSRPRIALAFQP
jgi:hypothetical protein